MSIARVRTCARSSGGHTTTTLYVGTRVCICRAMSYWTTQRYTRDASQLVLQPVVGTKMCLKCQGEDATELSCWRIDPRVLAVYIYNICWVNELCQSTSSSRINLLTRKRVYKSPRQTFIPDDGMEFFPLTRTFRLRVSGLCGVRF